MVLDDPGQNPHHGSTPDQPNLDGRHPGILQKHAALLAHLTRRLGPKPL
jgi:hypothetical protein